MAVIGLFYLLGKELQDNDESCYLLESSKEGEG